MNHRYNGYHFFKDAAFVFSAGFAFFAIDCIAEVMTKEYRNHKYNGTLTAGDWKDIGAGTGFALLALTAFLILKHILNHCNVKHPKPFEPSEFIAVVVPPILLFGLELGTKALSDFHNEKGNFTITGRELVDCGASTFILLLVLFSIVMIKNAYASKNRYEYTPIHNNQNIQPELINYSNS